jgi:hypothetical protein
LINAGVNRLISSRDKFSLGVILNAGSKSLAERKHYKN